MGDLDPLFELRNMLLVGNYQAAINEGLSLDDLPEKMKLERDVLVYRAYVAKGDYDLVLNEINDEAPGQLLAVRNLASYLSSPDNKEEVLALTKDSLADSLATDPTVQLIAGIIHSLEEDYDEALRALHQPSSLECRALLVQTYLQISRLDLAQKELESMKTIDDDATITQLATAWVDVVLGADKLEEAFYIYTELIEKWNATPLLLNGIVACQLGTLGKKDETKAAEQHLLQALEKNANEPDTVVNLVTCYHHMNKPKEAVNRYISQLKSRFPEHPWVRRLALLEESFDRNCARFSASAQ